MGSSGALKSCLWWRESGKQWNTEVEASWWPLGKAMCDFQPWCWLPRAVSRSRGGELGKHDVRRMQCSEWMSREPELAVFWLEWDLPELQAKARLRLGPIMINQGEEV